MNIDNVIEVLSGLEITRVIEGKILLPSDELQGIETATEFREYVSKLSLNLAKCGFEHLSDMPRIYQIQRNTDEYLLQCDGWRMFHTVILKFKEHGQLPPYLIMAPYHDSILNFKATSAKIKRGRIVNYDYVYHR